MEGVGEDAGQAGEVADAHDLADAGVVAQAVGADEGGEDGGEASSIYAAGGDAGGIGAGLGGVGVRVVRGVAADVLEQVLDGVADEVEAAEDEEDTHGEAGEDLGALEPEGVADATPLPDLEVAEDLNDDADEGGTDVEEDQVREGGHGQRPVRRQHHRGGDQQVAEAPVEPAALVSGHGPPRLLDGGDGQVAGQRQRRARRRFLEDLMLGADTRVLVFMTAALADVGLHRAGGYDLGLEVERVRRRVGIAIGIGPVDGRAIVGIHGARWIRA